MKTKIKITIFLLFVGLFLPLLSANAGVVPCGLNEDDTSLDGDQTVACTLCHLIVGIKNIIDFGLKILVTVAFVGIFIAGVMYIISAGSEEMMKRAKEFLKTSLTGFTLVLCAWLIVNIVMWVLSTNITDMGATNWYTFTCNTQSSATPIK
jgi:hypothetical protein